MASTTIFRSANLAGANQSASPIYTQIDAGIDYTTWYNHWLHSLAYVSEDTRVRQRKSSDRREILWECWRRVDLQSRIMSSYGYAFSRREAINNASFDMKNKYGVKAQMDSEIPKESNQGLTIQDSVKDSNTIITRDAGVTETEKGISDDILPYVSSEKVFEFGDLVGRWMPLRTIKVSTSLKLGENLETYFLPESLFEAIQCAPNLIPYETFFYSKTDIKIRFVVNANRFQCGKVIASVKFDSYQADAMQNSVQAACNRPHVILDLSTNNEGVLNIPFRYHRGLIRNVKNDQNSVGVRPSKQASVYVQVLSQLRTGAGAATDMFIRPYLMFENAHFAGMTYRAKVQMDTLSTVLQQALPSEGLRNVLIGAEKFFHQIGSSGNQDKPTKSDAQIVIPRPRLSFATGKGLSDAQVLKMSPDSLTSYGAVKPYGDEPKSVVDIARIWGLRDTIVWKQDLAPNKELAKWRIDPTSRSYDKDYEGTLTPLEYIASFYNFWSGPMEMRFDFVSNAFHTGSVMCTVEFGRPVMVDPDVCSVASNYTKTFHLGEQKSFTLTIPYIYDTPWRRSTASIYNPDIELPSGTDMIRNRSLSIRPESKTIVRLTVINELRPVSTVSQEIDVLIFMRAGPNMMFHGLKQSSYYLTREMGPGAKAPAIDSFPRDNYRATVPVVERKRRIGRTVGRGLKLETEPYSRALPEAVANEWNEYRPDKIPFKVVAQMDKGEKEDLDSTADFGPGRMSLQVQTSDSQMNLKDILRRPVNLIWRHTVQSFLDKTTSGFFIPLMPPSREMAWHASQAGEFTAMVSQTPQAMINNLFRFWRGSMRYTICVENFPGGEGNSMIEPIYIVHVPHSGTRLIGNQLVGSTGEPDRPLFATGLSTEMLIPCINPTITVEVPYDTENNWTLMFEEDAQRNYSWRDKGDTNSGHLVVCSPNNCQITVWWSAGDDFAISNFYGVPDGKMADWKYQWSDAHARVQMDSGFQEQESKVSEPTFSRVKQALKKIATPEILTRAAVMSIPYVGPGCALATMSVAGEETLGKVTDMSNKATTVMNNIDNRVANFGAIIEKASITFDSLSGAATTLIDGIKNLLPTNDSFGLCERVFDFIVDLVMAWIERSWRLVAVAVVKIVTKVLGIGSLSTCSEFVEKIATLFNSSRPRAQAPSREATMTGVLLGLVGTAMGVVIKGTTVKDYFSNLLPQLVSSTGINYLNGVLRFVTSTFDTIKEAILEGLGYVSPEAKALKMLSGKELVLRQFITQAQTCMSEANTNMMLHPNFRIKFWYTVTQAYQIQQTLMLVPQNVATPQLAKLCNDLIKTANEKFVDLSCSPVRYEPFVICIEGGEGIGKSYMTEKLVAALLEQIGYKRSSSGWTYTRAPGSRFWSGLRDQPVIVYDDWMNLNNPELMSQQLSELYQLKSTGTFIPEMAHLEEKRIKANPLIVVLLTNGAFPSSLSNVAHHPRAVYRRRDVVLRATLKHDYVGKSPRDLEGEESANISHLTFHCYKDPTNANSLASSAKDWIEVKPWLQKKFERYHKQEEINVRTRLVNLRDQLHLGAEENYNFEDPFSLLYQATDQMIELSPSQNAWVPSEQLEAAVIQLVDDLKRQRREIQPIVVPPEPEFIFEQGGCDPASWLELCCNLVRGFVLTPPFMAKLLQWTSNGLSCCSGELKRLSAVGVNGECAICFENKELCMECDQSPLHRTCLSCYNSMAVYDRTYCPVCRHPHMKLIMSQQDGFIASVLWWISRLVDESVVPAIRTLVNIMRRHFNLSFIKAMTKIQIIGFLLSGSMTCGLDGRRGCNLVGRLISAVVCDEEGEWFDAVDYQDITETWLEHPGYVTWAVISETLIAGAMHNYSHICNGDWVRDVDGSYRGYHSDGRLIRIRSTIGETFPGQPDYVRATELNSPDWVVANLQGDGMVVAETAPNIAALGYNERVISQMDRDDWDDDVPEAPIIRNENDVTADFRIVFNEQGFKQSREIIHSRLPRCYHHLLRENIDGIRYFENQHGRWWKTTVEINGELQIVQIPDGICAENCAWGDEQEHRNFAGQYIVVFASKIRRNYLQYVNGVMIDGSIALKQHPRFARPTWEENNIPIPEVAQCPRWWEYLSETYSQYKSAIISCLTIGTTVYSLYRLYNWFSPSTTIQSDPNYNPEHARFVRRAQRSLTRTRQLHPVSSQSEDIQSVVNGYILRNYINIRVYDKDNKLIRVLLICGIFNYYAILPRHYLKFLRNAQTQGATFKLCPSAYQNGEKNHEEIDYPFDEKDFIWVEDTDIAIMKCPPSINMFKDIRKFMVTDKDLSSYISDRGQILVGPTRKNSLIRLIDIDIGGLCTNQEISDDDDSVYVAWDLLRYNYSEAGICGSLVTLNRHTRPIVAMHCAGSGMGTSGFGYGVLLTQEALAEILNKPQVVAQFEDVELESVEGASFIFGDDVNVRYLGSLKREDAPHIPQKTKIRPSVIQGVGDLKPRTEPAILTATDPRYGYAQSPLWAGCEKHGKKTKDFPTSWIRKAEDGLYERWIRKIRPSMCKPKRLTIQQAILGFPALQFYDAMSLSTSAGYPWTKIGGTSKEDWITVERDEMGNVVKCEINPDLENEIYRKEKLRKQGIVPYTPFVDTLKDERKSKDKVGKYGGTRIFCASPVDYTIATRQNLLHFCTAFMRERFKTMSAVGINVHASEWSELYRFLAQKSCTNIVTLDYSNFGPAFNAKVAQAAASIIKRWTLENVDGVDELELDAILSECINSIHICGNTVYQQTCGSPSGAAITVIINSLVNLLYILITWQEIMENWFKEKKVLDIWKSFEENVALCVYGDDLIMSVTNEVATLFNTVTIQEWLKGYGITAQDVAKLGGQVEKFTDMKHASFLKRKFMKHPTREYEYLAPLEWISINDITQWIWSCANETMATVENCESAMLEAHAWGPKVYSAFRDKVNLALLKKKCSPITITWDDIDNKYYNDMEYPFEVGIEW